MILDDSDDQTVASSYCDRITGLNFRPEFGCTQQKMRKSTGINQTTLLSQPIRTLSVIRQKTRPTPILAKSCGRSTGIELRMRAMNPMKRFRIDLAAARKPMRLPDVAWRIQGSMNWLLCGAATKRTGPFRGTKCWPRTFSLKNTCIRHHKRDTILS